MPAKSRSYFWNDFEFTSNIDVAGADVWHDLLELEVNQNALKKLAAGSKVRLRVPTADQETGVDISTPDSYTVSLSNSITSIDGPSLTYQVQAFADGTELSVSSIDEVANEVTIDTSGSTNSNADLTVFYIANDNAQMARIIVRSTQENWGRIYKDDLGSLHTIDQRNNEEQQTLTNTHFAPEFFKIVLEVNSDITYLTDTSQDSGLNDYDQDVRLKTLELGHKHQDIRKYIAASKEFSSKAQVKSSVIQALNR